MNFLFPHSLVEGVHWKIPGSEDGQESKAGRNLKSEAGGFPGGPVVKTPDDSTAGSVGLIPGQGSYICRKVWTNKETHK